RRRMAARAAFVIPTRKAREERGGQGASGKAAGSAACCSTQATENAPGRSLSVALGGEDLVEQGLGLVLVGVLRQSELTHQDLPRLGQHPLLAGRQTALAVAAPQVTDDLGDLVDVTGGDLLDVRLVPAGPVGRLLGVGRLQDLEDPLEAIGSDDVTDTDVLRVVGGDPD